MLCFPELRGFHRAFRRWTGQMIAAASAMEPAEVNLAVDLGLSLFVRPGDQDLGHVAHRALR